MTLTTSSNIKTLIVDIEHLLKQRGWADENFASDLSKDIAVRLRIQFGTAAKHNALRMSKMGNQCPRALWYSIHQPELAESLPAWANLKYSFGHTIEALAIALAKSAGHLVTGEQDELVLDGIVGHRDCVIDGCIVDVKSAASRSFNKFKSGSIAQDDLFGYLDQLDCYVLSSRLDPLVTVKDKGYLLVIDKQLGHMCVYEHRVTSDREAILRERISRYKKIIRLEHAPPCECGTHTEDNGNTILDTRASYSSFKHSCFPRLRTFLYAGGPVYMTRVVKRPFNNKGPIPEVDKVGNPVYN